MKKIFRTVAMVLVLVMIASSFTGCFTIYVWKDFRLFDSQNGLIASLFYSIFTIPLDIITSPIQITVWAIQRIIEQERDERGKRLDGVDTFSSISSLPELDSLTQRISSLPEEKIVPFTETFNSFSKEENLAMLKAFNNLSEEEIASSIKILNSMPEEKLISAVNKLQLVKFRCQNRGIGQ